MVGIEGPAGLGEVGTELMKMDGRLRLEVVSLRRTRGEALVIT